MHNIPYLDDEKAEIVADSVFDGRGAVHCPTLHVPWRMFCRLKMPSCFRGAMIEGSVVSVSNRFFTWFEISIKG